MALMEALSRLIAEKSGGVCESLSTLQATLAVAAEEQWRFRRQESGHYRLRRLPPQDAQPQCRHSGKIRPCRR